MSGIVNPFPERNDGLPIVDSKTGRVIGTAFERPSPRPTHIRLSCAFGCLQPHNGRVFQVVEWCEDGNPCIMDPTDPARTRTIYVCRSEWIPAESFGHPHHHIDGL